MKNRTITALFFILTAALISLPFAIADEEEVREKYKDNKQPKDIRPITPAPTADKFKANFSMGARECFDNNVFLDPSRKGDLYDEGSAGVNIKYNFNKNCAIKTRYDFTSITYHEFTDLSMLDNDIAASLEYYLYDKLRFEAGYEADFLNYLRNENGTLYTLGPFTGLRYFLNPKFYAGAGYQYQFYDYAKRKINSGTNVTLDTTREDHRHNIIAELGTFFGKFFLKVKNTYYFNDSNDEYMDYYDYRSDKVISYIAYSVNKSISLFLNGGYQRKDFESRQITTSSDKEHDDLMILGGGIYYMVTPSAYISANYTYRQNYSNDPIQEYSGSSGSVGFSYFF